MDSLTFWEKAVGLTFNPSGDERVIKIKTLYAQIIDELHNLSYWLDWLPTREMVNKSIQEAQTAQMWAVKAITWKD
jgi:hypothetical protein